MNIKNTLPTTKARQDIFKITSDVQRAGNYYTLTERGVPKAVIMSANDFDSWQETLDVMREMPNLDKDVLEAERDYKKGDYVNLEAILAKQGFVLADKSKNKYAVSSRRAKKSAKRVG